MRPEHEAGGTSRARLHDRFVAQAGKTPDAAALLHDGRAWSYRELDERSNQLAHLLRDRGVRPNDLVAVCLDRSGELVAALIAVLKAGAAYVPLDPAYPVDRLAAMLDDSAAALLVTRSGPCASLGWSGRSVRLDADGPALDACPRDALPSGPGGGELACVFYTSGSTGRPKGVMLRHTATAMIDWATASFPHAALARIAATTSVCFDPSVFEIFTPLSVGGTVVLKRDLLEPFAPDERPSLLNGVPSAFAELARAGRIPDTVQVINVGGERLTAALARDIHAASRVAQVWNHYGPTETTICATVAPVARGAEADPPIGQPIAGALLYVLDEAGRPVRPGETGELFIGGPNLAAGYLNLPALTAERFLPDPHVPGGRMYRTGDLVRRNADGEVFFVARLGRQVKVRGFRIELDEIEAALQRLPAITNAVVLATERDGRVDGLVAVVESGEALTLPRMREALRRTLPAHMLPGRLVVVPSMPLTPSGKVDRQALSHLDAEAAVPVAAAREYTPPLEEAVVGVYRELLRQPRFGQNDDFFDHGGDSLLALAAAERLEELLGHPVPVTLIHHGRTAATLAPLLPGRSIATGHLTTLQPGGAGRAIFCLPDIFGRPLSLLSLAAQFAGERPVHGLSVGPLEDVLVAEPSLAVLTPAYARAVRQAQARGPYVIAGYSAGAIPAIDLANALRAAGDEVTLLLIDPRAQRFPTALRGVRRRGREAVRVLLASGWRAARQSVLRQDLPYWVPAAYLPVARALAQAEADWRAIPFQGPVLLARCRAAGRFGGLVTRLRAPVPLGWSRLLRGPVRVTTFDADHYDVVRRPAVSELAGWIGAALDQRGRVAEREPRAAKGDHGWFGCDRLFGWCR